MTDYVMVWDCKWCGHKGIMGYEYKCPGCSHPRSRNVVFYDPPTPIEATAEQMRLMGGTDPNWYCLGCDSGNVQSNDKCWNCGTPRGQAPDHEQRDYEAREIRSEAEMADFEAKTPASYHRRRPEATDDPYNPPVVDETPRSTYRERNSYEGHSEDNESSGLIPQSWMAIGGGALALLALAWGVWFFFFNTHTVNTYVSGYTWSQNVTIDEYRTMHEEGWSVPGGGRVTNQERRKNGQDKVHDGYTTETYTGTCTKTVHHQKTCYRSNGNGSKSSYDCSTNTTESYSCPKTRQTALYHYVDHYDTWYWYDIDRWITVVNKPTSGNDHNPVYDPIQPAGNYNPAAPVVGDQRRVEHPGKYTVSFSCDEPGPFTREYDLETWKRFNQDTPYVIKVNPFHVMVSEPDVNQVLP